VRSTDDDQSPQLIALHAQLCVPRDGRLGARNRRAGQLIYYICFYTVTDLNNFSDERVFEVFIQFYVVVGQHVLNSITMVTHMVYRRTVDKVLNVLGLVFLTRYF